MKIQNPITHHPLLSGVKFAVVFVLVPLILNVSVSSWYALVAIAFYPIEILCLLLFITGNKDHIDSTEDFNREWGSYQYVNNPHPYPPFPYF